MIGSLKITPYAIFKSLGLIALMVGLIALNPIELYSNFPDSHKYSSASVCYTTDQTCNKQSGIQSVSLPHFIAGHSSYQTHTAIFQISLDDLGSTHSRRCNHRDFSTKVFKRNRIARKRRDTYRF